MVSGSIQLAALGIQDKYLTQHPKITFFKKIYRKHTHFATAIEEQFFKGEAQPTLDSSRNYSFTVKKEGDLIKNIFLQAAVTATTDKNGAYTINHFGNSLIEKVELLIGGFVVDKYCSQWAQVYDELTGNYPTDKIQSESGLKGGKFTDLNFTSDVEADRFTMNHRLSANMPLVFGGGSRNNVNNNTVGTYSKNINIPLKFWFNRDYGYALPICALDHHEVEVRFTFLDKNKLIGNSVNLSNMSVKFKLYVEYIYLDIDEKRRFMLNDHEYLFEQVKDISIQLNSDQYEENAPYSQLDINSIDLIEFRHPIKYFSWVVVNEGDEGNNSGQGPCYFVSLCNNSLYKHDGNNGSLILRLNSLDVVGLPMYFFTRTIPNMYCNNIPELDRIGLYSFALKPFELEPTGSINFSRIKSKQMFLSIGNNNIENLKDKKLFIFGVNYNVLKISKGTASVLFT